MNEDILSVEERNAVERTKHELDEITASHAQQSEWLRRLQRAKNEAHSVGWHSGYEAGKKDTKG